jgi:hypothetical protein
MNDEQQSGPSFEDLLAYSHLQFDTEGELLPHMITFGPAQTATPRQPWLYTEAVNTTAAYQQAETPGTKKGHRSMKLMDETLAPIKAFYERWVGEMAASDPVKAITLPRFEQLDASQLTAWMHAYAATVTVSAHMGTAILLTMGEDMA